MTTQIHCANHSLRRALPQTSYRQPAAAESVAVHTTSFQPVVHGLRLRDLQKVNMKSKCVVSMPKLTRLFTLTGKWLTVHKWKTL